MHTSQDSKAITEEAERERIYALLTAHPRVRYSVHVNDHKRIDEINILQATLESMRLAVETMPKDASPQYVLIDGNKVPKEMKVPAQAVVKVGLYAPGNLYAYHFTF